MMTIKRQKERNRPPNQSMNIQPRVKETRKLRLAGPKAKTRTLQRKMRSIANTRQRKETDLIARKRVGPKAEEGITSTQVMTNEVAQGAKTEMPVREKRKQNLINSEKEISILTPMKSLETMQKEEMVRESQSHKARKEDL